MEPAKLELAKLRELLGVSEEDTSRDAALRFVLEATEEMVLNYCNLAELPAGLTFTCYRMACDMYRFDRPDDVEVPLMVTSITEGDISTGFSAMNEIIKDTVLKDYTGQLNRYRRLRRC